MESSLKNMEKAIHEANLGIAPTNNGEVIMLTIPELTGETRKKLVKECYKMAEDAKVAVRNIRRDANDALKKMNKGNELSEDELKTNEDKKNKRNSVIMNMNNINR